MNYFSKMPFRARLRPLALVALGLALVVLGGGCATSQPPRVRAALRLAKVNRPELEKAIRHYRAVGDPQKLEAAYFLIANMESRGYGISALYDEKKHEIPFDALSFGSLGEAQAALDKLEQQHGKLDFGRKKFVPDLETVTADYLIENIDLSFVAWRTKPWAKNLTFAAFLELVVPYRGNNEPVERWRPACMKRYEGLAAKMKNPNDLHEAAGLVMGDVGGWVGFYDLYYMHPTDQGFAEMDKGRRGRCGDITTMTTYALRANAIPSAGDYTPFWADRDNNHAWTVILDEQGEGRAGLSHRAAKVYRKTFAHQLDSLACQLEPNEKAPRWLSRKNYLDVTPQYMATTDVPVQLVNAPPKGARFAYLCVFNGGEWRAIHWAKILHGRVTFTQMGRNLCYLPAYYVNEKIVPAGPPLIVDKDGAIQTLAGGLQDKASIQVTATAPKLTSPDTHVVTPVARLNPGKQYELFAWKNGWQSLARIAATGATQNLDQVHAGQLYWMVEDGSHKLERIFTIRDGQQVWW